MLSLAAVEQINYFRTGSFSIMEGVSYDNKESTEIEPKSSDIRPTKDGQSYNFLTDIPSKKGTEKEGKITISGFPGGFYFECENSNTCDSINVLDANSSVKESIEEINLTICSIPDKIISKTAPNKYKWNFTCGEDKALRTRNLKDG